MAPKDSVRRKDNVSSDDKKRSTRKHAFNRASLRGFLLTGTFAALTFAGLQLLKQEKDSSTESFTPENLKTQFHLNARSFSPFAASDEELCLGAAILDFVAPLREKITSAQDTDQRIIEAQEVLSVSRPDLVENFILPMERKKTALVREVLGEIEDLILHLAEEGLLTSIPKDVVNFLYSFYTAANNMGYPAFDYGLKGIYIASGQVPAFTLDFIPKEKEFLHALSQHPAVIDFLNPLSLASAETLEEKKGRIKDLTEKVVSLHLDTFGFSQTIPVFFQETDNNILASYNPVERYITLSSNFVPDIFEDRTMVINMIVHESTHALLDLYFDTLSEDNFDFENDLHQEILLFRHAVVNYTPANISLSSYQENLHERFATRAGFFASSYFQDPKITLISLDLEQTVFSYELAQQRQYQESLQHRQSIPCDIRTKTTPEERVRNRNSFLNKPQ